MSVYVVARHTAAHPSPKSILWVSVWAQGCSDGDRDGEGRTCEQKKTVCDSEAYRGPCTLQHGRAALPLTGSPGNTLTHETAKKTEHALCYTHTHFELCTHE